VNQTLADFDEHNPLLFAALGARAVSERFDAWLRGQLRAVRPTPGAAPEEDPVLLALLGVIVLSDRIQDLLERAREAPQPQRWCTDDPRPPSEPGSLLR